MPVTDPTDVFGQFEDVEDGDEQDVQQDDKADPDAIPEVGDEFWDDAARLDGDEAG